MNNEKADFSIGQISEVISLIDLTLLNEKAASNDIANLCDSAITPYGMVASICIFSNLIPFAKQYLTSKHTSISFTTVINFPHGSSDDNHVIDEIETALNNGADEIDMVVPYRTLINDPTNTKPIANFIKMVKDNCNNHSTKAIIETGELKTPELIKLAAQICIDGGVNFIKTSTGKTPVGASLEAASVILNTLKENSLSTCGIKVSGGIRTIDEALAYCDLAKQIMGKYWINKNCFRIGTSQVLIPEPHRIPCPF